MGPTDLGSFLDTASELLAIPSTSDRPGEPHRALGFVLAFTGPGFTVERFESGGKPSALVYRGSPRPEFGVVLNAHLDVALVQAQVFRELAASLPIRWACSWVTDEETGGRDGTRHQLDQGVTGRFVIIVRPAGCGS